MSQDPIASPLTEAVQLSAEELEQLWRTDGMNLTQTQQTLLPEVRKWLQRRTNNALADLLIGKPIKSSSPELTKALTADVLARFQPQSRGLEALALLTRLIDRGNNEGLFRLCPPPIAIPTRRQPSPFEANRWPSIGLAPWFRAHLADSVRTGQQHAPVEELTQGRASIQLGQALLSAIVHGGLIAKASLEALLAALARPTPPLQVIGGRTFLELSLDYKKQHHAEFRRWFPDPLTTCLLMRIPPGLVEAACGGKAPVDDHAAPRLILRCIRAFVRQSGAAAALPKSLAALLDAVRLDLESRIPIYLTHYAARSFVSHSLKPSAFRRLHGIAIDPAEQPDLVTTDLPDPDHPLKRLGSPGYGVSTDAEDHGQVQARWLNALCCGSIHVDNLIRSFFWKTYFEHDDNISRPQKI